MLIARENLKAERALQGFTQEQLASRINITTRQYQSLEAGTSGGSMKVWKKLSRLFDKPIDHLEKVESR